MTTIRLKKIDKWDSIVTYDMLTKLYTISYAHNGGAITSDINYNKAKNDYINGMILHENINKIFTYAE